MSETQKQRVIMKPMPNLPSVCALFLSRRAIAQPIAVPQQSPYTNDANTMLLEHFDGATTGSAVLGRGQLGQTVFPVAGSPLTQGMLC